MDFFLYTFRQNKMMRVAVFLVLLAVTAVHGYSNGAPTTACQEMTPNAASSGGHGANPSGATFPYQITFSKTCFKSGDSVDGK